MKPATCFAALIVLIVSLSGESAMARDAKTDSFVDSPYPWPEFYYWPYYTFEPSYSYQPSHRSTADIAPFTPPAYIDQGTVYNIQSLEPNDFGYCSNPAGYYPYVTQCLTGWQKVDPQPIEQQPGYWYYCSQSLGSYPYVRECPAVWRNVVP
ncbi:MAG: hypothetical protein ACXWFI_12715 [Methylobacter sp.]